MAHINTEIEGHDNEVSKAAWEAYDITECCNDHDACYGTCGKPKKTCDRKLLECMKKKCEDAVASGLSPADDDTCIRSAQHMEEYTHVNCGEFKRLQKDGCDCHDGHKPGELPPADDDEKEKDSDDDAKEAND